MSTPSAPPELEERFLPPEGWQWRRFENKRGKQLRYGFVMPEQPAALVIGLQGLSEYGEKYFEIARDMKKRNLGFFMMDWQGQGLSGRYLENGHKRHADDFGEDIADLHQFIEEHVKPAAPENTPLVMLAHSMGANIGLRYLARHDETFSCAAFTAPMVGIGAIKNIPNWFILFMNKLAADAYARLGNGDWNPSMRDHPLKDIFSSDPVRKRIHNAWKLHDPRLQVGEITFGWVHQANLSCRYLQNPHVLRSIHTPCLAVLAEHEKLVDNKAAREAFNQMACAKILDLPGSKHEILMERDGIRRRFFHAFDELLAVNGVNPSP